ncbi:hypothetical protein [Frondihabitans peucedani]|uniref:Uncharacterized protein n=1 Tax=Frondihabitans peucedani TaxID=598626 RepID=A0ABP8E6Q8_9MICO
MGRTELTVGGRRLGVQESADELRETITGLVRDGGGFVTVTTGSGAMDLLVSPALEVAIRVIDDVHDEKDEPSTAGAATIDYFAPAIDDYDF